jgi:hypothetical protein
VTVNNAGTPGLDFSHVVAGNGAALDGTLDVNTNTQPPSGSNLEIITLTAGVRTGTFPTTTGTSTYTITYNPTSVVLVSN